MNDFLKLFLVLNKNENLINEIDKCTMRFRLHGKIKNESIVSLGGKLAVLLMVDVALKHEMVHLIWKEIRFELGHIFPVSTKRNFYF